MNRQHRALLGGVSLVLSRTIAAPNDARSHVDKIFSRFNSSSPGCAAGATINGSTVLSAGYGMADLEHNVAIAPESIFEAGSVSKQFTMRIEPEAVQDQMRAEQKS